jgi:hypothetical protein
MQIQTFQAPGRYLRIGKPQYILKIETEDENDKDDGKFSNGEPLFQVSTISSS